MRRWCGSGQPPWPPQLFLGDRLFAVVFCRGVRREGEGDTYFLNYDGLAFPQSKCMRLLFLAVWYIAWMLYAVSKRNDVCLEATKIVN